MTNNTFHLSGGIFL